jgi:large subunit ribosomal protein L35
MKKVKQKTKKAVVKRFKLTKTGKVLHRSAGMRHLNSKKSKKQLRSLKTVKKVENKKFKVKLIRLLGK